LNLWNRILLGEFIVQASYITSSFKKMEKKIRKLYSSDKCYPSFLARSNRDRWSRKYRNARAYFKWLPHSRKISIFSARQITLLRLNLFPGKRLTQNAFFFSFLFFFIMPVGFTASLSPGTANSQIPLDRGFIKIGAELRYTLRFFMTLLQRTRQYYF